MGPVIFIMGVSGSGKTTIGSRLSEQMGIPFFDGDDFHSTNNREKMKSGQPLTDDDRWEWLEAINKMAIKQSQEKGAIIACSALKEKYRQRLMRDIPSPVQWVCLAGEYNTVLERIQSRKDHFMPASLLQSQFEILEVPVDAIRPDISKSPEEIVNFLLAEPRLIHQVT